MQIVSTDTLHFLSLAFPMKGAICHRLCDCRYLRIHNSFFSPTHSGSFSTPSPLAFPKANKQEKKKVSRVSCGSVPVLAYSLPAIPLQAINNIPHHYRKSKPTKGDWSHLFWSIVHLDIATHTQRHSKIAKYIYEYAKCIAISLAVYMIFYSVDSGP